MALRHSLFLYNTNKGSVAVPIFLHEIFGFKLCSFLFVLFQLIKMKVQLIVLDSAVEPAKVICHGIKDIFYKNIVCSAAEESGKSAVTLDVCSYDESGIDCVLYIVGRFQLSVEHVVILHVHECGIRIRLGIAVAFSTLMQLPLILPDFLKCCFQIFDILLQLIFSASATGNKFNFFFHF